MPRVCRNPARTHVLLSFQGVYSNPECTRPRFSDHFQRCCSSNRRRLSLHPASKNRTAAYGRCSFSPLRRFRLAGPRYPRKGIFTRNLHSLSRRLPSRGSYTRISLLRTFFLPGSLSLARSPPFEKLHILFDIRSVLYRFLCWGGKKNALPVRRLSLARRDRIISGFRAG